MNRNSLKVTVAAALLSALLAGCIVAPAPGYYGETVGYAPPAAQYEAVVGVAPAPGYFWIGGGYFWEGGRYAWHPGYWAAPRAGLPLGAAHLGPCRRRLARPRWLGPRLSALRAGLDP